MCDKKSLKNLTKKELLSMISKMKKDELINIIYKNSMKLKQRGGEGGQIIKETKNAVRKSIVFNQSKLYESVNNDNKYKSMNNNSIYNNVE